MYKTMEDDIQEMRISIYEYLSEVGRPIKLTVRKLNKESKVEEPCEVSTFLFEESDKKVRYKKGVVVTSDDENSAQSYTIPIVDGEGKYVPIEEGLEFTMEHIVDTLIVKKYTITKVTFNSQDPVSATINIAFSHLEDIVQKESALEGRGYIGK